MIKKPLTDETRLLHGGDYNPDQWLAYPEILKEDVVLMQKAHTNTFSIGIFAWAALEPEEGSYNFTWLDEVIERIASFGGRFILATPSGARPTWMSKAHPEVLRVDASRRKQLHGGRHNHCFSSPYYRKKTQEMNTKLAERYGGHPALLMWHVSNEFGGECHCNLCQQNFRTYLKDKYNNDLDQLNESWWGPFWSHTITDWEQIESPSRIGESAVHGMNLDWRRFVSHQTIDFYKNECMPLREITPGIPITTNFMSDNPAFTPFTGLDYSRFAEEVDVISWDAYPAWHNDKEDTATLASKVGFLNDHFYAMKDQPFLLMESTPSGVNWHEVNKAKRPGMHYLSSMQMLAHGSDSVLYFQWRKSRGSSEKFHGAVVDHDRSPENRVFKEVARLGKAMEEISPKVVGYQRQAKVAIIYDVENEWALNDAQGFGLQTKKYGETLEKHYQAFWDKNIAVDVVSKDADFSKYDLVIAPMLYMLAEKTAEKLQDYVKGGGTLVSTYITGVVNESDLAHMGGWLGPLKATFGMEPVESDTYYPSDENSIDYNGKNYLVKDYATVIEMGEASGLAVYQSDFYKGKPAVTVNAYGKGQAYYLGARLEEAFLADFYGELISDLGLRPALDVTHERGVSVQAREAEGLKTVFIMNFTEEVQVIEINEEVVDIQSDELVYGRLTLQPYEVRIVEKEV
ncbi:beta-galactosidase [Alkalibacterium subtropicum]|uniref:Beta-galactosidase n=1 Tax=Alkalibacterium subtropicum TaxID=753702 RepID=A0A1I1KJP3_9LACT|nr:beta-galactosidase [Alkalibacterium subtropicum]SFC61007.1 beta-galactosidase [Alkalibacterium subtropicum]